MASKVDISISNLVEMIHSGQFRLPEMQRRYVWRATRVRDLLDSLYRGYPSGSILVWETDQAMPTMDMAVDQKQSPFAGHKLLLDGQQRATSLAAILRGEPVTVGGLKRPIEILFNLDHPDGLSQVTEVDNDAPGRDDDDDDDGPLIQQRLRQPRCNAVTSGARRGFETCSTRYTADIRPVRSSPSRATSPCRPWTGPWTRSRAAARRPAAGHLPRGDPARRAGDGGRAQAPDRDPVQPRSPGWPQPGH